MLCSISQPSPSSSWLDRLRSSKGFPIPTDLDLERFLSSNPNPNSSASPPAPPVETHPSDPPLLTPSAAEKPPSHRRRRKPPPPDSKAAAGDGKSQLLDLMTSVLAELFVMGGDPNGIKTHRKKSHRKQLNPKLCAPSASASADGCRAPPATSPSSADNSVAEAKKSRTKARRKMAASRRAADSELVAYSRTEVTVIDTSAPAWKAEKVVFRKGLVWKVRDKKVWNTCRKKRKLDRVEKLVNEKAKEQPLIELKVPAPKEPLVSLDEGGAHPNHRDAAKEAVGQIQIPLKRPKFSRSPRLPMPKDSSVFQLQVVATNRKNRSACPRRSLKGR